MELDYLKIGIIWGSMEKRNQAALTGIEVSEQVLTLSMSDKNREAVLEAKEKVANDMGKMFKGHLVGKDFEEKLINERTDGLTCSWQTLQSFCFSINICIEISSLYFDVSSFLQCKDIYREVYVIPPLEVSKVWKI